MIANSLRTLNKTPPVIRQEARVAIVATNPSYARICRTHATNLPKRLRRKIDLRVANTWEDVDRNALTAFRDQSLVVGRLADISPGARVAGSGGTRKHLLFMDDLPVEAIPARVARLNIRDARRLHIAAVRGIDAVSAMIGRVVRGLAAFDPADSTADHKPIVDAWLEEDSLLVISPLFERLEVPLARLSESLGVGSSELREFKIDADGSFLHWPRTDHHLGWEQLEQIVEPTKLLASARKNRRFNEKYGAAIRALREERGFRQSDISGLTDRHIRRIEQGAVPASSSALKALAAAHEMKLADYMRQLAKRLQ